MYIKGYKQANWWQFKKRSC